MTNETEALKVRAGDREVLEGWLRMRTLPRRLVERAQIVLAAADGPSSRGIAQTVGVARGRAPGPYIWIKDAETIIDNINRGLNNLAAEHKGHDGI